MRRARRITLSALLVALALALGNGAVWADSNTPLVIDSEVLLTDEYPEAPAAAGLLVQATSWPGRPYRYVLTVLNATPWTVPSLRVVDRYLPADPEAPEITSDHFASRLEPGRVASWAVTFPDGALPDACHQIEIAVGDGLGSVLMDCSRPGATTLWRIAITDEMEGYLTSPPLTAEVPEGPSKVGLHVTRNASPAIMEFVRNAQPAVIMAVGDLSWLADARAASPDTVIVARLDEQGQAMEGDPQEAARAFVQAHRGTYLAHPEVDYWLGWNEPAVDSLAQMDWFAAFEAERAVAMAELGLRVAVGNFSVGTPEPPEFERFLPAIRAAKEHDGALALHEYGAPTMRAGVGSGVPGIEFTSDYGALTLRYRIWYDYYLRANDLVLPLIITEAGIDGGVLQGDRQGGWRAFGPADDGGNASLGAERYLEQLSWYDDQLRRDPYVLGFAIFNAGDISGRWDSFDVTDILPQLADLALSK